jgi:hypothetical protein
MMGSLSIVVEDKQCHTLTAAMLAFLGLLDMLKIIAVLGRYFASLVVLG